MAITVTHSKVSAIPDGTDTSVVRPSDWNATHTLVGVGTAASLDAGVANGVATLDSGGQVPLSQLPPLGDLNYQGAWNATTNSPTLTSSTGTKGYYYVVSVAGTTSLNGITDWQIGDWAVFNGSVWQKIDNTDAVTSVNGYTGTVVLTQTDISGTVPTSRTITAGTGLTGGGDLSANRTLAIATTGVTATTYGSASSVPVIAVNTQGQITSATNTTIAIANTQVSGLGTMSTQNANNVTITGGTLNAVAIGQSTAGDGSFDVLTANVTRLTNVTSSAGIVITGTFTGSSPTDGLVMDYATGWGRFSDFGGDGFQWFNAGLATTKLMELSSTGALTTTGTVTANGVLLTGNLGTVTSVTGTAPVVSSGGTTPAISMAKATTSVDGYLSSTDWTTFNNKQPAGSYLTTVTSDAPLTGSGTSGSHLSMPAATTSVNGYLTYTDWNTFNGKSNTNGTVTSVAALTLGTTGTDLSSTVATGTTTPVITLQVPTASASNRGALSSTDWSTFNGKQAALVSGTNIKTVAGVSLLGAGDVGLIGGTYGGTGVNNGANTITVGGNVNYSGAFTQTWTRTANTSLTLPVSGTVLSSVTAPTNNPVTGTPSSSNFLRGDGTWASPTSGLASYTRTSFTATASQTTFTVTYTVGYLQVYVNGVLLNATDYTASNGTSVVLATGCNTGDIVETIAYTTTTVAVAGGSNTQVQYNSSGSLAGSANMTFDGTTLSASGLAATGSTTGSSTKGAISYGTLGYSDVNHLATFQSAVDSYSQIEIQNTNATSSASSDVIVANNNTTASTFYGDFGMNSSAWTGTAGTSSLTAPNMVYLTSTSADLTIGTTTSNVIRFVTNGGADKLIFDASGNVGIGVVPTGLDLLELGAGTTSKAPLGFTSGSLITSPDAGSVEFDGNNLYFTTDTSQGRTVVEAVQQFYLSAAGSALTGATQNYFGSTSAASLAAASTYDIECYCYFLKTTSGTMQWIPTFSSAITVGHSYLEYTPVTGFTTTVITGTMVVGEATQQTTTVLTHTATAALTTAVYHIAKLRIRVTTNLACNFRLNGTISAGTITPQAGSFYTVRKVVTSSGNFVA